ncbi:MAG: 2-succinyl-5-enolpyruvyl-6-hydroxy-3-cyclohexene-1-carboxylic-acid synthase [Deltaproteobacteria bacterium]|nr:2-succinyl-5-enolpyruvyl-6-hydroxy-3-cyclohexene-1-carboxylic-acid synthase [Deltaproteobacteria bacterium]
MTAAIQTIWSELLSATLADAGITTCVLSPGSRSTPLVAALAGEPRLELVTIIDERAAAFFALGVARATGRPAALVCTSGTAGAHYLPAIIEASLAGIPLVVLTADRPPELQACGASQTIDQVHLYGGFVRGAFDLGAPVGQVPALRGLRRKLIQAITLANGPHAGPVHLEVPLRKPLEPAVPTTDDERAFARAALALRGAVAITPPRLAVDPTALAALAAAIAAEPDGLIVVGAMPAAFAAHRDAMFALAARSGYPVLAEAGSQLRFGARPAGVTFVDHVDLIAIAQRPAPRLILQVGAEPVAASWPAWLATITPRRWVLGGATWSDPDSAAHRVILGEVGEAIIAVLARLGAVERSAAPATFGDRESTVPGIGASGVPTQIADRRSSSRIRTGAWLDTWRTLEARAIAARDRAVEAHPRNEVAAVRAAIEAVPPGGVLQIGNSLPIRVVDHLPAGGSPRTVLTQRGAAGIDGLIASAAGATHGGQPVLLVLGDVSFAHDLGGLLAARCASAPLAIVVVDNRGGQIFAGLPVARAGLGHAFDKHFITAPELDPSAVAVALGASALTAASPAAIGTAVATALATPGVTVIHAPVSVSGAHDVRRTAIEAFAAPIVRDARSNS